MRRGVPPLRISRANDEATLRDERSELGGRQIRRGEMLAALVAAANCDPNQFEQPHKFDITRHPNPHLSFGTGVHFCLGFQLARGEASIGIQQILDRFPHLRLAVEPTEIRWYKRLGIWALKGLPVRLAASAGVAFMLQLYQLSL
jgi:cytochrome P450